MTKACSAVAVRPGWARSLLLVALLAAGLSAQADPGLLRERLDAGEHQLVLDVAVTAAQEGKLGLEVALLGAEAALHLRAFDHASSLADKAKGLAPEDPRAYELDGHQFMGRAESMLAKGGASSFLLPTWLDGATMYRRARELGGDAYANAYHEAECLWRAGRRDDAAEAARIAVEATEELPPVLLRARILAEDSAEAETRQAALAMIALARERAPDSPAIATLELEILARDPAGHERLGARFRELLTKHPQEVGLYNAIYLALSTDSPPRRLRELLTEALAMVAPEHRPLTHWYLGRLCGLEGLFGQAVVHLETYLEAFPDDAFGHATLAGMATRGGQLARAAEALARAEALGGAPDEALVSELGTLVAAYVAQNAWAEALGHQRRLLRLQSSPTEERNLGVILFHAGQEAEALATYRRLLEDSEADLSLADRATVWNFFGLARFGQGELDDAEEAFRRALALNEEDLDARENLGILLLERGDQAGATAEFDAVLASDPRRDRSRYHRLRARHGGLVGNTR